MALREILLGILRGCGHSLGPKILSLTGMVGVRQLFLAIAMRKSAVVEYIYDCYPVTWAATLLLAVYYLTVRKRLHERTLKRCFVRVAYARCSCYALTWNGRNREKMDDIKNAALDNNTENLVVPCR